MVQTRSAKMTQVTDELFQLINEIKDSLDTKATNAKIDELLDEIRKKDEKIEMLEKSVENLSHTVVLLTQKIDDIEARSRRGNLRISGIPLPENKETGEQCLQKVKEVFDGLPVVGLDKCSYSRAHRVGKVSTKENGEKQQAMIVGFSTWKSRTLIYKNRKLLKDYRVSLDLTKRRLDLRTIANERVKGHQNIEFCMADINCSLCLRLSNNKYEYFNSEAELDKILQKY